MKKFYEPMDLAASENSYEAYPAYPAPRIIAAFFLAIASIPNRLSIWPSINAAAIRPKTPEAYCSHVAFWMIADH